MRLRRYLDRLHTILTSRDELILEFLHIDEIVPGQEGIIDGRLRFWDGSLLEFSEILSARNMILVKTRYAYHYLSLESAICKQGNAKYSRPASHAR